MLEIFARARGSISPSVAVRALLEDAVALCAGISLPAVMKTEQGKPYFPDRPDLFFSLSHSGSLVLCAVGDCPCGADVQEPRRFSERLVRRCFGSDELALASPSDLWCLKESFIKLNGSMDRPLREMRFFPDGELFRGPDNTVGRVWHLPEGYTAALVCRAPILLPEVIRCPFPPQKPVELKPFLEHTDEGKPRPGLSHFERVHDRKHRLMVKPSAGAIFYNIILLPIGRMDC